MSAAVLVVGLDACDPSTAEAFAGDGTMPVLAGLLRDGARAPVATPFGLLVGGVWRSIASGLRADRAGLHCWDEIGVETYEHQLADPALDVFPQFWDHVAAAGRRVAVVDVPHAKVVAPPAGTIAADGLQVIEWGCHDRHNGLRSWPPEVAADLLARYGPHPIFGVDALEPREFAPDDYVLRAGAHRTPAEERGMADGLVAGTATKARLLIDLLGREQWDLFVAVLGDSHAVGHQQWHLHDPTHPRFDPAAVEAAGGDPVRRVYAEMDRTLGQVIEAAEATQVLVLLSHGMGPHHDGTHLLEEVLRRLDAAASGASGGGIASRAVKGAMTRLPLGWRRRAFPLLATGARAVVRRRPVAPSPEWLRWPDRIGSRYLISPNNYVYGGVRLNVVGREVHGVVEPGAVEATLAQVADDLLSLVNVATGRPVVNAVVRCDEHYDRRPDDRLPDLFLDWERSAPVEVVWSPKTGLVHVPYTNWRTGDHRPGGLAVLAGAAVPRGATLPPARTEDLAPTIARWLDVELDGVDGRAVRWPAPAAVSR